MSTITLSAGIVYIRKQIYPRMAYLFSGHPSEVRILLDPVDQAKCSKSLAKTHLELKLVKKQTCKVLSHSKKSLQYKVGGPVCKYKDVTSVLNKSGRFTTTNLYGTRRVVLRYYVTLLNES